MPTEGSLPFPDEHPKARYLGPDRDLRSRVWAITTARYPLFIPWVRFSDNAALHWEIDNDLHLERLASRDW